MATQDSSQTALKKKVPYTSKFKPGAISETEGQSASPFKQLTKSVWLIPGENPGMGYLCGTNVFVIGTGKSRVMVDACTKNVVKFISNIKEFCEAQDCNIDRIMITHGHHDHYAGAYDVVELLIQQGFCSSTPKIYKHVIDSLETDKNRIAEHPEILNHLFNTREGDVFMIEGSGETAKLTVIETPGHIDDHLCFMLEEPGEETVLFTGDHIIGADSTYFTDYPLYLESLEKVRLLTEKHVIKKFLVAHSYTLKTDDILLDAMAKVLDQIEARKVKDLELEQAVNKLGKFTLDQLYEEFHSHKGINTKFFTQYMKLILYRRLQKLLREWKLREEKGGIFIVSKL